MNHADKKIIDTLRALGIDMIDNAQSGHPGIVLGAAPIIYTLYSKHIKINTLEPNWINRDRFVLSAGHGSALLYATLFLAGYNITIEDLKQFRQLGSITPGHPENFITPGVDATTGPLGQGIANAVGIAIGEKKMSSKYNIKKCKSFDSNDLNIFDHYTYVLVGDGDLMEGVSNEAASLAGTLKLGKLIVLYDSNNISLDGGTDKAFTEDVCAKYSAMNWHTQTVSNGEDVLAIDKAISKAKLVTDKPSLIEIKTVIGKYSVNEGSSLVHGSPLSKEDILSIKNKMNIRDVPFAVSNEAVSNFREAIKERNDKLLNEWYIMFDKFMEVAVDTHKNEVKDFIEKKTKINFIDFDFSSVNKTKATREINGEFLNIISTNSPFVIGGSADLSSTNKTYIKEGGDFSSTDPLGKNIWFGVREHAMASIVNGLATYGFIPYASTFLCFSDYLKPSVRLSCLMNLNVNYIFTHDSILVGEDGPTHQPVEQLAMLRSIPRITVFRPADYNEIHGMWKYISNSSGTNAIVLSRNDGGVLKETDSDKVKYGAYIAKEAKNKMNGIIIATGSELSLALKISESLYSQSIDLRVVSMPSMELFLRQDEAYRQELLPIGYKVIVIEFASSFGWHRFVYNDKYLITVNDFGVSAKKEDVLNHFELTYDKIEERIKGLFL